jgi:hypothetical protein
MRGCFWPVIKVNKIIDVVQARKEYQELPPVLGGVAFSFPPRGNNKAG